MIYAKINPQEPDPKIIDQAVDILNNGGVLVYPTDTLYGLGVDVTNEKAVSKVFELKGRPKHNPISLMVDSLDSIEEYGKLLPVAQHQKLLKILPGKYTILLKNSIKKEMPVFKKLRDQEKIGWRVPDTEFCRQLSAAFKKPISTTSANISGKPNVENVQQAIAYFGNKPDMIIDAGPVQETLGSTILDFTKKPVMVLREGEVKLSQVREELGTNDVRIKKTKYKIIFVCSGNICRSPMAEGVLKAMFAKTRYRNIVEIASAGTLNIPTSPAHDFASKIASANEIDIYKHMSQHINQAIVDEAELIIGLAINHVDYLRKKFNNDKRKIILLKEWKRTRPLFNPSVADPIGHALDFFSDTFAEIHTEIKRILPFILSELKDFMRYHDLKLQ